MYNLTERQKDLLHWMVKKVKQDELGEEFSIHWVMSDRGYMLSNYSGDENDLPEIERGAIDSLAASDLILCEVKRKASRGGGTYESSRRIVLRGAAFEAVGSDFDAPDTSFVRHLEPLGDVVNLDDEIQARCLPILGAGASDPKLWDAAVRTAGVILEERVRSISGFEDEGRVGRDLINDVFGQSGLLAHRFDNDSERQGFRDLFAGLVGAIRNPYAHRLVDPSPAVAGTLISFIDLLLKLLDDIQAGDPSAS